MPFLHGVVLDHTQDVTIISNCRAQNPDTVESGTFAAANAVGVQVFSAFSVMATNIFVGGLKVGISCDDSPDAHQRTKNSYGQVSNFYTDNCKYGFAASSTYTADGSPSPGWTLSNFYCAGGSNTLCGVALSPGGHSGSGKPSLQVLGGSLWGGFPDGAVSLGATTDHFRASDWLGYN